MARPQTLSDVEIIEGARRVIREKGYDAFTLSDVAKEVGLSRPAILKRFKSTHALKLRVSNVMADAFISHLKALPVHRSGDGLLQLVDLMGGMTRSHSGVARFFIRHRGNLEDAELAAVERRRGKAWMDAILARMPDTELPNGEAARMFGAVLAGSVLQWQNMPGANGANYLRKSAENWLTLARVKFTKRKPRRNHTRGD